MIERCPSCPGPFIVRDANGAGARRRKFAIALAFQWRGLRGREPMVDLEPEAIWLRHRVRRLRTILRYAKEPRVESGLRELIAQAEERLDLLEQQQVPQAK